jgi:hypothetical protein
MRKNKFKVELSAGLIAEQGGEGDPGTERLPQRQTNREDSVGKAKHPPSYCLTLFSPLDPLKAGSTSILGSSSDTLPPPSLLPSSRTYFLQTQPGRVI